MGLISDILFGRKFSYSETQVSEAVLKTAGMAALLSSALGEEFAPKYDKSMPGHASKSGIIAVMPGDDGLLANIFGGNVPEPVGGGSLERVGDAVGYRGGTMVQAAYYNKITSALESNRIAYGVIALRDGLRPLVIKTPECNIAIAPFITPP